MSNFVPTQIYIGDTVNLSVSDSRYPAPTWSAVLKIGDSITITSSPTGTSHTITATSATTQNYTAGEYSYQLYITDGTQRFTLATGRITIRNISTKSHARAVLEAIEATILGSASQSQSEMSINGRAIKYFPPEQLLKLRATYKREVANEEAQERINAGLGSKNKILVRF